MKEKKFEITNVNDREKAWSSSLPPAITLNGLLTA